MIITKTLKFNRKAISIIIFDIVFLLAILSAFLIAVNVEEKTEEQLSQVRYYGEQIDEFADSGKGIEETEKISDELTKGTEAIKSFFFTVLITIFGVLAFLMAVSTLIKGYIYSLFFNINYKKFLRRFALVNLCWQVGWVLLVILTFLVVRDTLVPYLLLVEIILYLILTPVARSCAKENFFKNFGRCLKRIYMFIIPTALIILAGFVVYMIVGGAGFVHPAIMLILSILLVIFISWSRYYYYLVVRKCIKLR